VSPPNDLCFSGGRCKHGSCGAARSALSVLWDLTLLAYSRSQARSQTPGSNVVLDAT
jgi:hypothetical protein